MESLASWRAYAEEAGVPDAMIDHLEGRFEQW
jgi:hypothetical protein